MTRITDILHGYQYIYILPYLPQFFLESEMFQTRGAEKIKTHILYSTTSFENRAVCQIRWKNSVESGSQR